MSGSGNQLTLTPLPAVLGFLVPGLGYVAQGDRLRGALVFTGVVGLVVLGTLVGGIDVVDRKEDFWWFVLQAGTGPIAWALDWIHQYALRSGSIEVVRSLGRVNEVGSLAVGLGGMINAIAVIDCLWRETSERRYGSAAQGAGA